MLLDATKPHSTPLVCTKPNEISHLVAGVGFEPTTFRLSVTPMNSIGYRRYPWLGRYLSGVFYTGQMKI